MANLSATISRVKDRMLDIRVATDRVARMALALCEERGIRLTPRADHLLSVVAEAWTKEPPEALRRLLVDQTSEASWIEIGQTILGAALEDPRVQEEMQALNHVTVPTLMHVLVDSGHRHLVNIGYK
jgi:hypothetical protein